MTISIPAGRIIPIVAKSGAGFWAAGLAGTAGGPGYPDLTLPAGNIVSDDFSSGDLDATGPTGGFTWGTSANQRFTSLVTMDPTSGDPTVILTSGGSPTYNVLTGDPRDWNAFKGDNSLRFAFVSGTDPNVFAQQDCSLVSRAEKKIFMRFALRVPTNFTHENLPNTYGENWTASSNNKLFRMWMQDRNAAGETTVGMEFRPNGTGGSNWYLKSSPDGGGTVGGDGTLVPFITTADRGRWMYIHVEVSASSSNGVPDGYMTVHRRWASEANWVQEHSISGKDWPIPADTAKAQGFANFYLMGADNSGYAEDTEFLLDDFNLSTESLL